jgi:hypothetical protein
MCRLIFLPPPRSFADEEVKKIITNASEPLSTIVAVTAVLGLRSFYRIQGA